MGRDSRRVPGTPHHPHITTDNNGVDAVVGAAAIAAEVSGSRSYRGPVNNPSQQMLSRPESALSAESVLSTGYSIMTVNSNIVLPRICMKYQNMLAELTTSHGTIQS